MVQGRLEDALNALYRQREAQPTDGSIVQAIHDVRERVTQAAIARLHPLDRVAHVLPNSSPPEGIGERYLVEQLVDGTRTIEQILDLSTLGRHRTARALTALVDAKVIQIEHASARIERISLVTAPAAERPRAEPATSVVLVADANPTQGALTRTLTRVLMGKTTQVLKAESGTEVVELARKERPNLLLLDFSLRDIDAIEVLRQLKGSSSSPAAVVFVERLDADFVRGKLPPGVQLVVRPVDKASLKQAIDRASAAR